MWKNILPVYRAGIWTHDLGNMSLLPKPLDQGSRPFPKMFGMTKYASKVLETFDMKKAFLMRFKENCLDLFRLIFEKRPNRWQTLTINIINKNKKKNKNRENLHFRSNDQTDGHIFS